MKTFNLVSVLFLSYLLLISCDEKKEITIGFLMESYSSARWTQDRKHFEERVAQLGGKTIVKYSDGNDATQFSQAMEFISQGVDVLAIVSVNSNTSAAIVREAHKKNIKVIAYDRFIANSDLDYFVGFDNEYAGILQASYAIDKKPIGNFVQIEGDRSDVNAISIDKGQTKTLEEKVKSGDVKILYKVFVDGWNPAEASHELEKVIKLTNGKIDAVLTANDGTASGAISKLKEYGLENDVIITGLDAELAACQRIYRGEQSMTVYSPIKDLAITAANLAIDLANKRKPKYEFTLRNNGRIDVPIIILKPITVDKENLESTVIKDGVYTKEEIEGGI